MRAKQLLVLLLLSVLPIAVGCRSREQAETADDGDTATMTTEHEVAGVDQPNDLNPVEAQSFVDDVTLGRSVGADGRIAPQDQADDFAPGDAIHLTMKVGDAPAGSPVKVVWYGPGEQRIAEEEKEIAPGATYLTFQAADTGSWQKGDYRAEIWVGDEKVNQQQFQIDPRQSGV